jgi:hypothetical protein
MKCGSSIHASASRRGAGDLRYTFESGHSVAAQYMSLWAIGGSRPVYSMSLLAPDRIGWLRLSSVSCALLGDIPVGMVRHQQRRDDTDNGASGYVAGNGVAGSGPGQ